jgi:hypothetical protein
MWKTKDHNVSETGSVSVLRWMGQDKPTQFDPLERASLNQPVSSVGDRNKITIKDMIEISAKHAHVKKCKKRKYGLDARNSVRNESKNLEEINCVNYEVPHYIILPMLPRIVFKVAIFFFFGTLLSTGPP